MAVWKYSISMHLDSRCTMKFCGEKLFAPQYLDNSPTPPQNVLEKNFTDGLKTGKIFSRTVIIIPRQLVFVYLLLRPSGYQLQIGEGESALSWQLSSGLTWRKKIWPRLAYPQSLHRWNTVEVGYNINPFHPLVFELTLSPSNFHWYCLSFWGWW